MGNEAVSLSVPRQKYRPNDTITVKYDMKNATYTSGSCWIGLIPSHIQSTDEYENDNYDVCYFYVRESSGQGTLGRTPAGSYHIKCFANDGGGQYLGSVPGYITIGKDIASLTIAKSEHKPNEAISVTYDIRTCNYTSGSCWIGLIPSHIISTSEIVNDQHDVDYFHVSNDTGNGTLTTSQQGRYKIKCFANDNGGKYLACVERDVIIKDDEEERRQRERELERQREMERQRELVRQAEMRRQRELARQRELQRAAARRRKEYEQARQQTMEKMRLEALQRADKLAKAAERVRAQERAEADNGKNVQEKVMQRMKYQDAEKARQHDEMEDLRRIAFEKKTKEMEAQRKREEEAHRKRMTDMINNIKAKEHEVKDKMQQRQNATEQMRASIKVVDDQIQQNSDELHKLQQQYRVTEVKLQNLNTKIVKFNKNNDSDYKRWKDEMLDALRIFQRDDEEICAAIEKTGQREGGVGRFLELTHALIGETMASQDQANKLDAELHTFQTLIEHISITLSRECQDKLLIKHLFADRKLDRFVPILAKQNYTECQELIRQNVDEFNRDIMNYVEMEIQNQINEWNKNHPDKADPFEIFIAKYELLKYKQALKDAGLESLDDIGDDELDDETIEEIMTDAEITGVDKDKFKRGVNDVKTGKYKSKKKAESLKPICAKPQSKENDDQDDDKEDEKETEPKPSEVSKMEAKVLKNVCLNPESWQQFEKEKATLTRLSLLEMGPVFVGFFGRMHDVVQQAQKILGYSDKLNDEQNKAMAVLMENVPTSKAIEAPIATVSDDSKASDDPEQLTDYPQRKAWKEASEVQIYSKSNNKWYDGKIIKVFTDKEGEWLEVQYDSGSHQRTKQVDRYGPDVRDPVTVECRAIAAAIHVDINVTELMMSEFKVSETTLRVLPIARGVEQSAKSILLCQSQIRQSVRLAEAILKLKPANLSDTSKPLWNAVDDGINHIIDKASEMNKISGQYFGFFLKFNQSFQRFVSMNEQNKDATLSKSLQDIKQDITEFGAFKKEFNIKLQKLSDEGMKVIKKCVETSMGIEQFESTRAAREKAKHDYLDKKAKYDTESLRLDDRLEALKDERARERVVKAALTFRIEQLKQIKKEDEEFRQSRLKELNQLL
eukprot:CAMPEP_0201595708 /NCGR_PEP_ID=MMETSP0190_2-20130828/192622_1 /ASSEMBLY_ACC=CAM_ASM_000263 /TAXON_ID=37353 /ORGANISM="Rosalina sp." /LENGTH=1125 /DNA_ID=CAMNT_0048055787 /DNA_START=62 /DNA_END=3437 /DNA_ORIENTATION=+